jgi:simple sugar transport system ATP-binding protein
MSEAPLVEMRHIEKSYGRVHALRDVNLTIRRGEIVGLLGDNGAGKSTLIKVLSGAVPYTSGEIRIKGQPVTMTSTNEAIAATRPLSRSCPSRGTCSLGAS